MSGSPLENIRVFVSSTAQDLVSYREAVFSAVQELGGSGEDMLYWPADDRRPVDSCLSRVQPSDVLVLIVAHRYGYVPEGSLCSITELEYRAAEEAHIPILAFMIDPDVPWPPKYIEREKAAELESFKARVSKSVTFKTFTSPDHLKGNLVTALATFVNRNLSELTKPKRFNFKTEPVRSAAELGVLSDLTIELGRSPERLECAPATGEISSRFEGGATGSFCC